MLFFIVDGFLNCCFCVESLPNYAAMSEIPNWSARKASHVLSTKIQNLYSKITAKKGVIFDKIYTFGCEVYLSSHICQMRWDD